MEIRATSEDADLSDATLIVGVLAENQPAPGAEDALAQAHPTLLELAKFEGKTGQVLTLPHSVAKAVVFVGLGEEAGFESIRAGTGNAVRAVKTTRAVTNLNQIGVDGAVRAVVEGAALGGYQFREYKTEGEPLALQTLELIEGDEEAMGETLITTDATNLARDWVNTPALDKAPEELARRIEEAATEAGLAVEVWDELRIVDEKLGALLGVAAGSDRPPRLVIIEHTPDEPAAHLGLVGKGITFDSGGLSIKTAQYMEEMKDDMSGAAVVTAATIAIARLGLPIGVTTVVPLTDNAVGGNATRPGDVLRPVAGPTIEVLNTDAEGRLILADGLGIVRRYEPDMIVDVATLTGAAHVALGDKVAAVFASDEEVASSILLAASRAGEHFWELPLFEDYKKAMESDIADLKNISGGRYGGAITAALFLSSYVDDAKWAHLDIAGPARSRETSGEHVKGASGVGVRTLVELARSMTPPS
ncbi:MAG TPA: leucyl aminopeptidase [Acidimicrobiia bacterium]|nr:leucyl aminopeptidase [Acidimicrobiia bacterium]